MKRAEAVWLALLLALVCTAYLPALGGGLVWDDHVLLESPQVRELQPLPTYFRERFWSRSQQVEHGDYYRPLTALSLALDFRIWRGAPAGLHATNLLLHLLCCALLFGLVRRSGLAPRPAALVCALFGLFPRATESVAWISGRSDLLALAGVLGALALHRSQERALGARSAAAAALLCGLLAKEVALAGLAALLLLELWPARGSEALRRAFLNLAPAGVALVLYLLLRLSTGDLSTAAADPFSFDERVSFALAALGRYLQLLLTPLTPSLQIGLFDAVRPLDTLLGAGALAVVAGLGVGAWRSRKPAGPWLGAALAAGALLPVLHLVRLPHDVQAADRFLYLPAAGLVLAAASLRMPAPRARSALALGLALVLCFGLATAQRAAEWSDEIQLWHAAIATAHPANPLPELMFGEALLRHGHPERALHHLRRASSIASAPTRRRAPASLASSISGNLAGALAALGRTAQASQILRELIAREPRRAQHHYNLAVLYARERRTEPALAALRVAQELEPGYAAAAQLSARLAQAAPAESDSPPAAQSRRPAYSSSSPSFSKR